MSEQKLFAWETHKIEVGREGGAKGILMRHLFLAPGDLSGRETCYWRTPGCTAACLYKSGHGMTNATQRARIKKTKTLWQGRAAFLQRLADEIANALKLAKRKDLIPAVRLNTTSDLPWEAWPVSWKPGRSSKTVEAASLMALFPEVQFYDYTKGPTRALRRTTALRAADNYYLTFSLSETPESLETAQACLRAGINVAAAFRKVPKEFLGFPVTNGDAHDARFLDPPGHVVGLTPKGPAGKRDTSGFIRNPRREREGGIGCKANAFSFGPVSDER